MKMGEGSGRRKVGKEGWEEEGKCENWLVTGGNRWSECLPTPLIVCVCVCVCVCMFVCERK